ncbi:hypothetical protein BDZ90DRAFT_221489 [Jaminaea rosea]|uniref:HTH APSES-type domain-containing protein n=1 Tax=Jaminaea rosea TaxID=1569628 RepID=A0A316UUD7_9BASI|nr:hypothetical protein BDZ90DRAFT_221489 [Jaminaea rosea]PWN26715.1 hypothetical protein BDZ90DRAFT_221489 [Jaminaea rosea]
MASASPSGPAGAPTKQQLPLSSSAGGVPPRPPSPLAGPAPLVYLATYSNVPVYEITIRGIAVMRRRADGFLNATQILKVAGIEKAKRTKILEKEILTGEHEKVQGGYGKYQGTWIPLRRAQELAATYNVAHLLRPVLEFDPRTADSIPTAGPKRRPNPNAPANSALFKGANAGANANGPRKSSTPTKGPSQQPRFLTLRAPPSDDAAGPSAASTSAGIPPGSTSTMRQALSNYSEYGYTPQGVPLPTPSKNKRTEPDEANSPSEQQQSQPSKRPRADIGPSPVKDLAALVSPESSFRGASHPRLHRVPLGPPDELVGKAGNARFADRPQPVRSEDEGEKRMKERLVSYFMEDEGEDRAAQQGTPVERLNTILNELRAAVSLGGAASSNDEGGPAPCIDLVIDDHGHTALHWASALCRLPLVKTLVALPTSEGGANLFAGNAAGETALHRSVLVTNAYDASLFPDLLTLLSPTLHTRDFKSRTVLHHIALVAALKGRATPARYYLACLLEYIARHEGGKFSAIVDAQDDDGETALGIAARQGNSSMVKMLLEVGARKDLPNCLGLKPSDWGIDGGPSTSTSNAASSSTAAGDLSAQTREDLKESRSDLVTALMRPPAAPLQKSQDVLDQLRSILDGLSSTSSAELTAKAEALATAQSHLQSATRELTSRRKAVKGKQAEVALLLERRIRVGNLKRRLARVLSGRAVAGEEKGGQPALPEVEQSVIDQLVVRHDSGEMKRDEDGLLDSVLGTVKDSDPPSAILPSYRYATSYLTQLNATLRTSITQLRSESTLRESQCRRVVAMYSRIEEGKVEAILDDLVNAVETNSDVDLARVAGFLAKLGGSAKGGRKMGAGEPSSSPRRGETHAA